MAADGKKDTGELNPRTREFEFGGWPGTLFLTVFLPLFTVWINLQLTPAARFHFSPVYYLDPSQSGHLWGPYVCWFAVLAVLDMALPGEWVRGTTLRNGKVLWYKINGLSNCALLALVLALRWQLTRGRMPELQYVYENCVELSVVSALFAFALSWLVYLKSFMSKDPPLLAAGGNSGNVAYDWFIGRELNPRVCFGYFDIKLFCELRPGMLLWFLINLSCLHHNYLSKQQQQQAMVSDSLLLVNVLQFVYIFDGVLNEKGLLTMMDVVTDGFGFMLALGDLTVVPFTYTLQARYLSVHPIELGWVRVLAVSGLMALGYYIFHSSNQEKSDFRHGRLPHLKSISTKRGTRLLCDGWWGRSQHINYMGDWLISLSWCLATGFGTPLTYYYCVYFAVLLLHRQKRDELKCHLKYGEDWEEYQRRVPYKIIPYIY